MATAWPSAAAPGQGSPGSPAALVSSGSGPPGSTCTRSWVRRRTQEPKAALRPGARRGSSTLSRYSVSSQARALTPSGPARPATLRAGASARGAARPGPGERGLPGLVMLCTKGVTRASQNVLPSARAASSSGRKRLAKPCSCCSARFSLQQRAGSARCQGLEKSRGRAERSAGSLLCPLPGHHGSLASWPPAAREGPLLSPGLPPMALGALADPAKWGLSSACGHEILLCLANLCQDVPAPGGPASCSGG